MLSFKTKIGYGLGGLGDCASYTTIGTFAVFFLTTVVGIDPAIAGAIVAGGAVWQAICGAFVGNVSDHFESKYGKREPFMLTGAIPLGISVGMFFYTLDAPPAAQIIYYSVVILLFWTAYTLYFVPYLAWGSEITLNYSDRTALRGYAYLFNIAGMLIGVIIPNLIIDKLIEAGRSAAQSWHLTSSAVGVIVAGTLILTVLIVKSQIKKEQPDSLGTDETDTTDSTAGADGTVKEASIRERGVIKSLIEIVGSFVELIKFKPVRMLILCSVFYLLANTFFNAGRMYYFTFNLELSATEITIVFLCMEAMSAMLVPIVLRLNRVLDKRVLFIGGMSAAVALLLFLNIIGIDSFFRMAVFISFYAIGGACYWQLSSSMMYDACEADKLINKCERSGLIMSFQVLSESLSNAIGLQLLGIILKIGGFVESATVQTASALVACKLCAVMLPLLFMFLTVICVIKYPITKSMYSRILDALDREKKGESIDMDEFNRLL